MKRIINCLLIISSLLFMAFITPTKVFAEKIEKSSSGWYFERADKNGNKHYSGTLKNYSINGEVAYCIEPGASDNGSVSLSDWSQTGLSNNIKERILLIGYYGYSYPGHNTKKYRAATQCLIWEAILGEGSWCKINTQHWSAGTNIDLSSERKEINRLVSEHGNTISFNGEVFKTQIGETIELTDTNNMLSNFDVTATEVDYSINDNKLTLKTKSNRADIYFTKRQLLSSNYKIFTSDKIQNILVAGNVDPTIARIRLNTYYGNVELTKEDSETTSPQGEATLKGAEYGIYDTNNNLITKIITDSNGKATSEKVLEYGNYYLKEITPSNGYLIDNNRYDIESKENETVKLNVKEQVIKSNVNIVKYYEQAKTGEKKPESNVSFELYNSNNSKINELITDENGLISVVLPYGKYRLHQTSTKQGFYYSNDIEFNIESNEVVNREIVDKEVVAKLKVIKIDKETKQVIKRANIKFKIYDVKNKEYVCQIVNNNRICEFKTDSNGIMITPQVLYSGTYKLVEIDQPISGYTWNKESIEFTIDEKAKLITDNGEGVLFETKFENKRVKGNLEITKYGEELIYENNSYRYNQIKLSGVKIGLYQNNKLIKEYATNEEGIIEIKGLELGKYTVKEISTVGEHVLDNNEYIVDIKYLDQYTETVKYKLTINNYLPKGTLEFTKTDISKSKALPNTLMEIYSSEDDRLIFSGRTDENGQIIIKDLPINKYYLLEKEAPKGYVINPNKQEFEILENGQIVVSEMQDEMIVKVPITDKIVIPDYIYSIILIIASIGLIVYASKKKKK